MGLFILVIKFEKQMEADQDRYSFTSYSTLNREHPDVSYWKREDISLILSKGLSRTCQVKPANPIEYFATWLLEYNKV